jgi:hypothetical protein
VALDLLEDSRRPLIHGAERPDVSRAANVRTSLILRLLIRIPLRQRQVRELQLGRDLYRNPRGDWQLHFAGAGRKVGRWRGHPNIFAPPFPPDLGPHLEAYLRYGNDSRLCAAAHNRDYVQFRIMRSQDDEQACNGVLIVLCCA